MPGGLPGGAWAVLELTGTLLQVSAECRFILQTGGVNVERTFCDGARLIWGTLNTEHCLHFTLNST